MCNIICDYASIVVIGIVSNLILIMILFNTDNLKALFFLYDISDRLVSTALCNSTLLTTKHQEMCIEYPLMYSITTNQSVNTIYLQVTSLYEVSLWCHSMSNHPMVETVPPQILMKIYTFGLYGQKRRFAK